MIEKQLLSCFLLFILLLLLSTIEADEQEEQDEVCLRAWYLFGNEDFLRFPCGIICLMCLRSSMKMMMTMPLGANDDNDDDVGEKKRGSD